MPRHILKYKLHGGETPWYIEEAGLYVLDGWHYGISKDDDECYIPSEIEKVTKEDLKVELGKVAYKYDGRNLSKQEKDDKIDERIKTDKVKKNV